MNAEFEMDSGYKMFYLRSIPVQGSGWKQVTCGAGPTKPRRQLWSKHCLPMRTFPVGKKCQALYHCPAQSPHGLAQAGHDLREAAFQS